MWPASSSLSGHDAKVSPVGGAGDARWCFPVLSCENQCHRGEYAGIRLSQAHRSSLADVRDGRCLTIAIHSPSSSRSWAPDYRDSDTEWIAIVRPRPRGGSEITVHPSVLWGCQTAGAWNAVVASDSRCCIILSGGAGSLSSICANDWSLGVLPGAENRAKQHLILLIDVSLLIINIFRWRMKDTEGFLRKSSENAKNRACL